MQLIDHAVVSLEAGGDDFFVELITEPAGKLQRRAAAAKSDRRERTDNNTVSSYDAVAERFVVFVRRLDAQLTPNPSNRRTLQMSEFRNIDTVDTTHGPEIFVTDLIKAEHFGVRLTFGVPDQSANYPGEPPTMIVAANLIVPPDALADMLDRLANPSVVRARARELRMTQ